MPKVGSEDGELRGMVGGGGRTLLSQWIPKLRTDKRNINKTLFMGILPSPFILKSLDHNYEKMSVYIEPRFTFQCVL